MSKDIIGCTIVVLFFLSLLVINALLMHKHSVKQKYIFTRKIKNINWKYAFYVWLVLELMTIFCHIDDVKQSISTILILPLFLWFIIFIMAIFNHNPKDESKYIRDPSVLKSFERENKINKILK